MEISNKKMIMLLRHGETAWNAMHRFQGGSDVPLNGTGEAQARAAHDRVMSWKPQVVIASPLCRARLTARLATGLSEDEIIIDNDLREIGFGKWEGRAFEDIRRESVENREFLNSLYACEVPSAAEAETIDEIMNRSARALKRALEMPEDRVLMVAHGGLIRGVLACALGVPFADAWRHFKIGNCCLTVLTHDEGSLRIVSHGSR